LFAETPKQEHSRNADSSIQLLTKGNARYLTRHPLHPHQSAQYRVRVSTSQHPFAAVLSCSDSRVPPEIVFDEGLGDLFVVRVAGNVADDFVTGSLEYAAHHLHVPLILVLGHSNCGAVQATIAGGEPETHVNSLVLAIKPAVEQAAHEKGDLLTNAVRDNVIRVVEALRTSQPVLAKAVHGEDLKIKGAVYHLDTGKVEFLP
jgi:carbonic anhydrase